MAVLPADDQQADKGNCQARWLPGPLTGSDTITSKALHVCRTQQHELEEAALGCDCPLAFPNQWPPRLLRSSTSQPGKSETEILLKSLPRREVVPLVKLGM